MERKQLIELMAADGKSEPQAADELDRTVDYILKRLRKGEVVALPGLGRLVPGPRPTFNFEKSRQPKGAPRGRR